MIASVISRLIRMTALTVLTTVTISGCQTGRVRTVFDPSFDFAPTTIDVFVDQSLAPMFPLEVVVRAVVSEGSRRSWIGKCMQGSFSEMSISDSFVESTEDNPMVMRLELLHEKALDILRQHHTERRSVGTFRATLVDRRTGRELWLYALNHDATKESSIRSLLRTVFRQYERDARSRQPRTAR